MAADTVVRARIDQATKDRAAAALAAMGLSISDAIRLLMLRIANEQRLPFEVKVPNGESVRSMRELEAGQGEHVAGLDPVSDNFAHTDTRGSLQEIERLYRQAFAQYGAVALWNMRPVEHPTPAAALAITQALRTHGSMGGRRLAEEIERLCHAAQ